MSLQRKSKWVKQARKTKEQGMHEERRISWAELFGQSVPKKPKKHHEPTMKVRDEVKKRDHGRCRFPGCNRRDITIHHVLFKSQFPSRKMDKENLICLCPDHHVLSNESPHQSDYWRRFWEDEAAKMYPEYWNEVRERA